MSESIKDLMEGLSGVVSGYKDVIIGYKNLQDRIDDGILQARIELATGFIGCGDGDE